MARKNFGGVYASDYIGARRQSRGAKHAAQLAQSESLVDACARKQGNIM